MRDETVKRNYFWKVEAVDKAGKVVYSNTYHDFSKACDKFLSFKNKATVSLQRKFNEYKVA